MRKPYPAGRGITKLDARQRERLLEMLKTDAPYKVIEERFSVSRVTLKKFARASGIPPRNSAPRRWL